MDADHLVDLPPDLHDGVQAGHGLLKDHGDLGSSNIAELIFRITGEFIPVKEYTAFCDLGCRRKQSHDRAGGHALAAAGLADNADDLAAGDLERDIVYRLDQAVIRLNADAQMSDI